VGDWRTTSQSVSILSYEVDFKVPTRTDQIVSAGTCCGRRNPQSSKSSPGPWPRLPIKRGSAEAWHNSARTRKDEDRDEALIYHFKISPKLFATQEKPMWHRIAARGCATLPATVAKTAPLHFRSHLS